MSKIEEIVNHLSGRANEKLAYFDAAYKRYQMKFDETASSFNSLFAEIDEKRLAMAKSAQNQLQPFQVNYATIFEDKKGKKEGFLYHQVYVEIFDRKYPLITYPIAIDNEHIEDVINSRGGGSFIIITSKYHKLMAYNDIYGCAGKDTIGERCKCEKIFIHEKTDTPFCVSYAHYHLIAKTDKKISCETREEKTAREIIQDCKKVRNDFIVSSSDKISKYIQLLKDMEADFDDIVYYLQNGVGIQIGEEEVIPICKFLNKIILPDYFNHSLENILTDISNKMHE